MSEALGKLWGCEYLRSLAVRRGHILGIQEGNLRQEIGGGGGGSCLSKSKRGRKHPLATQQQQAGGNLA